MRKTVTRTKVPDDTALVHPTLDKRTESPAENRELVRNLETLYKEGIISSMEFADVLEGWSRYVRRR